MELLKRIDSLLPIAHKQAIKEIFERLKAAVPGLSAREAEFEARRLARKVSQARGQQVFDPQLAVPGAKISSVQHNENMENAYIDIRGLYREASLLNQIQQTQRATLNSDYSKARAAILKLINDARVFSIRSKYPEFDDIKVIDFNIASNSSKKSPIAVVDPESRLLKLPILQKRRNHLRRRTLRSTQVDTKVDSQGYVGQLSREFRPELAVDSKQETFWAEAIYTDNVYQTKYNRWSANEKGESVDIVNGPVVKYNIRFSNAEAINQIRILPFSNFPLRVLEITYRESGGSFVRKPIKGFTQEESLDWMEFNFETILVTDVQIVFTQESYRNFIVHVPKNVLFSTDFMLRFIEERGLEFSQNIPNLNDVLVGGSNELYQNALDDLASLTTTKELEKTPSTEIDLAGKTIMTIGEAFSAFNPQLSTLIEEISVYTDSLPDNFRNEIETFNKLEYIVGAREIECNQVTYAPIAYYESPKFETASTVTNATIEVDERHPEFKSQFGEFRKTSTEWELEFAPDRKVPIFPRNFEKDGFFPVQGEFLDVSTDSQTGFSRFAAQLSFVTVRENGNLLVAGQDYVTQWDSNFDGKLRIGITGATYDKRKVYTIDYYAKQSAAEIDILDRFEAKSLAAPELFEKTGPNNEIEAKYYPFIDYGIINSEDFTYIEEKSSFEYTAPTGAYTTGEAIIYPTWVNASGAIVTGGTGQLVANGFATGDVDAEPVLWNTLSNEYLTKPYGYYFKIAGLPGAVYEIASFNGASGLTFTETPVLFTGVVGNPLATGTFSGNIIEGIDAFNDGNPLSGQLKVPYSIEVVYKSGTEVFGFDNLLYTPIQILVGGIEAKNITNYVDLEQPAFTIAGAEDGEYEYIHDGKTIYFNQSLDGAEIQANYRWMTQYIKVNCNLRTNKLISPTITPQIDEYRLLLNTTIL